MKYILLAIGLSCCAPFHGATRVGPGIYVESDVSDAPEGRAVYVAVALMMANWPGDVPDISEADPLLVTFTDHSTMPERPNGLYVVGYTEDRQHIYVQIDNKRNKASNSSLAHELVHVLLWREHGDPDVDHEEEVWSKVWTFDHTAASVKTNLQLEAIGW